MITAYEFYWGCSRWTSANRNHAAHIRPVGGELLCGKTFFSATDTAPIVHAQAQFFLTEINYKICAKCKSKYISQLNQQEK